MPAGLTNVISIAAGAEFSVALQRDGTVVGWGHNSAGQTTMPPVVRDACAVNGLDQQTLVLQRDGTVVNWGADLFGNVLPPSPLMNATAVGPSMVLFTNGTILSWGGSAAVPASLPQAIAIARCANNSAALLEDSTVAVWGDNSFGQTNVPTGLSNVVQIAVGSRFCLALCADSTVVAGVGIITALSRALPP